MTLAESAGDGRALKNKMNRKLSASDQKPRTQTKRGKIAFVCALYVMQKKENMTIGNVDCRIQNYYSK